MFYFVIKKILGFVFRIIYRIEIVNKEAVNNSQGRLLICANHINALDPVMLIIASKRQIYFMGKKELFENKFFNFIFTNMGAFPVDRDHAGLQTLRHSMGILKEEKVLGIFPEGTRVKEYNKENAKPGVGLMSVKTQAPVIPVYIDGNYRPFSRVKITFGDKIEFKEAYNNPISSDKYKEYGEFILEEIYKLKEV